MFSGRLCWRLASACAAEGQWAPCCALLATASSSMSAPLVAASTNTTASFSSVASTAATQSGQAAPSTASSSSSSSSSPPVKPWVISQQKNEQWLSMGFAELHGHLQQQLRIRNSQGEAKLLLLINKASTQEEVEAAVALVRYDHLQRARLDQLQSLSPSVMSALLAAGQRAGLGHSFALQLLQQTDELGLQVSLHLCEDVIKSCIKQQDYMAASRGWLFAQLFCADPSRQPAGGQSRKQQPKDEQQEKQQQQQAPQSQLGWASKSLLRVYALGVAAWLQQGGLSPKHKLALQQQLQQLTLELESRGAAVPVALKQSLQAAEAEASASAKTDVGSETKECTEK